MLNKSYGMLFGRGAGRGVCISLIGTGTYFLHCIYVIIHHTGDIESDTFFYEVPTIFARCTHFSFKENIVLG